MVLASNLPTSKYLRGLKDCQWLSHIRTVVTTSCVIVNYITKDHSVLVHCR